MTMPTQEAQRSRETAMQAERHFFVQRLQSLAEGWRDFARGCASDDDNHRAQIFRWCAEDVERLIAERTK